MTNVKHVSNMLEVVGPFLDRRTMIVGTPSAMQEKFGIAHDQLLGCELIQLCGELPECDPASELWQRIASQQPERVWIIGGDGTINLVGQCVLRINRALQYWLTPAGTANDLARSLAEPVSPLAPGSMGQRPTIERPISMDLLSVRLDGNPWVQCTANMFTLGTSARNTHHVTDEIKQRWGALAYLTQVWRAMGDLEPFSIRLAVGQSEVRSVDNILNLFVANGAYCGGGFRVAPTARIDDGLMDVIIVRPGTTAELASLATAYLSGNHTDHPLVEHFTTTRLSIECQYPSALTLDGEAHAAQRIEIEVAPHCMPISLIESE